MRDQAARRKANLRWRAANPEAYRESRRRWRLSNPETRRAASRRWYALYSLRLRVQHGQWRAGNPIKVRESSRRRRARKYENLGVVSLDIIEQIFARQDGFCNNLFCNADLIFEFYELDHILPLALGGKHEDCNFQLLCQSCNRRKGARHPDSFWEIR